MEVHYDHDKRKDPQRFSQSKDNRPVGQRKKKMANENETSQKATDCVQHRSRSNEELLCELTREYCFVSDNLRKLGNAIKADPKSVSEKHKELWKSQAEHMSHYKDVLALRIKDVLDNNK